MPELLDDRHRPRFRQVFGELLGRADEVAVAVGRVRLSGVDLRPEEVEGLRTLRVLTAEVSAHRLRLEAEALSLDPVRRVNLDLVRDLFREHRLMVRTAPLGGWAPDFSLFSASGRPFALLVGPHWFERPFPYRGPALGSIHGSRGAERIAPRFGELWEQAHDIGSALIDLLQVPEGR